MERTVDSLSSIATVKKMELTLIGCGILSKEVECVIRKNKWALKTQFLCSSLHMDFNKLNHAVTHSLKKYEARETIVFYGTCHPLLDRTLKDIGTIRTKGQNCIEILLGQKIFTEELSGGAFFLLEDWARRWKKITEKAFGTNPEIRAAIFQECHTSLLGIRTPCSGDFSDEAEEISREINLPLRWMDVSLNHLELTLKETIEARLGHLGEA